MKLHLPLSLRSIILSAFVSYASCTSSAYAEKICGYQIQDDNSSTSQYVDSITGESQLIVCHCDEGGPVTLKISDIGYMYVHNNDEVSAIRGNLSLEISDCNKVVFKNNESSELYTQDITGVKALAGGGAITGACTLRYIRDLSFIGNSATEGVGGAIDSDGHPVYILNCGDVQFEDNYAKQGGGAIGLFSNGKGWFGNNSHYLGISNNSGTVTFAENTTDANGGAVHARCAYFEYNEGPLIFTGNKAEEYGGAMYFDGEGRDSYNNRFVLLLNSNRDDIIFQDNIAGIKGGAIYASSVAGSINIVNNKRVIFQDNIGGAICIADSATSSSSGVRIQGNDYVLFSGNGIAMDANNIYLSTSENEDSSIVLYDPLVCSNYLALNTLSPSYISNEGTAQGSIYFLGNQSHSTVAGNVEQQSGMVRIEKGASLKVGGSYSLKGGDLYLEQTQQSPTPLVVGGGMNIDATASKLIFNLTAGIISDSPVLSIGGKFTLDPGCIVVDGSNRVPSFDDYPLLFVAGNLVYNGKTYTYNNDEWTCSSGTLKSEELLFDPSLLDGSYTLRWEDRTLFYSYLNQGVLTYSAKGYEEEKVWWGESKLSWYDVDKPKVGTTVTLQGDPSCWIAVACNMIQYWQDKYAPLYPGNGLITPTERQSDYKILYEKLKNTNNVLGANGSGSTSQMLSLWFTNQDIATIIPKENPISFINMKTEWNALGFTNTNVINGFVYEEFRKKNELSAADEKNEMLKKEVMGILDAWSKSAYSPIALSFKDGISPAGHSITVWSVDVIGDDMTITYTDSDCMENSTSTMKAKFVGGECVITEYQTSNGTIKADAESHKMPRTLGGVSNPVKWILASLFHISTPIGVDEMLADYYSDNEYYWTGKRISIKQIGDLLMSFQNILELDKPESNSLADETAGWKKNCNSKNNEQHVWANTYLTDSKSKLIFGDNVGNDVVEKKVIRLTTSFNVSEMNVCGQNYCIYNSESDSVTLTLDRLSVSGTLSLSGKMELKAGTLDVTGTLGVGGVRGVEDNVKISATNINIKGTLDLCGNNSSTIPVLDGCKKINMDGGVLECITLIVKKEDSVDSNLQEGQTSNVTSKYSITGANIQMENCTINETVNENKWGTIRYNICSDHDIHLNGSDVKGWEKVVFDCLIKSGNNLGVADNYNYALQISKARVLANVALVKSSQLGLSGGTLEVQSDAETTAVLTLGNGNSSADILISESEGGTVLAAVSSLMTLPTEPVYLNESSAIETLELLISEGSSLENHGSLSGVQSLVVEYDGSLSGNGSFGGTIVRDGGRLMVGGSPGSPAYESLTMKDGSELIFCVDGCNTASATENGWGSGTHSLLTVNQEDGLQLESGTDVLIGCSLNFLNAVELAEVQTLTLVVMPGETGAELLETLNAGTQFKLANEDDSLEALSTVGALIHGASWSAGENNTLTLSFIVSSCPENALVWTNASADGAWNVSSSNWKDLEGNEVTFADGANVLITQGGNIHVGEALTVGDVVVSIQDNLELTGTGSLGGEGALQKEGRGELTLSLANSYTGGTYVNGGKIKVQHADALGTGGVLLQSGTLEIGVNGVDNRLVNNGDSSLVIASGVSYTLTSEIYNTGNLTIRGTLNADALTDVEECTATYLDTAGNEGTNGFARDAGSRIVVVENDGGTLNAVSAQVIRNGKTHVLGNDGIAVHGGTIHADTYLAGPGHSVCLSEIVAVAAQYGSEKTDVVLDAGSLIADGILTGTLTSKGESALLAENWAVNGCITNEGTLSISGSIVADGVSEVTTQAAAWLDVEGSVGEHGFAREEGYQFKLVEQKEDAKLNIDDLSITRNDRNYSLDSQGVATAEDIVHYNHYRLGGGHRAVLSSIARVAAARGVNVVGISLEGGHLTADETVTGALTLGGGTLSLVEKLTVMGGTTFVSGTQTTIDISGWSNAVDGEVLVDFGSTHSGYTEGSLSLSGIEGDWTLNFDSATGGLALVQVQTELPDEPEIPDTPVTPDEPEIPDTPVTPDEPEIPDTPVTPDEPEIPDTPVTPDEPEIPDTPVMPDEPEIPDTPVTPDEPEIPDTPVTPDEPELLKKWNPGAKPVLVGSKIDKNTEVVLTEKGNVTLEGKVNAGAITVNSDKNITFKSNKKKPGSLTGDGDLTKKGEGTLTLNDGNSSWTGDTYLQTGTIKVKGTTSLGKGDVYVKGGTLNLGSKAIANDIIQSGTAAIKSGKKFTGSYTLESGELQRGSTLNIVRAATLEDGMVNGTLSGNGRTMVTGVVKLGDKGKITTKALTLGVDATLTTSAKGLSSKTTTLSIGEDATLSLGGKMTVDSLKMNGGTLKTNASRPAAITVKNNMMLTDAVLTTNGKVTTKRLTLNDSSMSIKGAKAQNLTVKQNLIIGSGAVLTLNGKLSAGSLTIKKDGMLTMSGSKPVTLKVKGALTLNSGSSIILDYDFVQGKTYKVLTFGSYSGSKDYYSIFGVEADDCTITNTGKALTLTVTGKWKPQTQQKAVSADAAEPVIDTKSQANPVADALVQANWGQLEASRAFVNAMANRSMAVQLGNGERAVWASAIGSSSRHDTASGHNGADTNVSGGAFGLETQVGRASLLGMALGNSGTRVSAHGFGTIEQDTTHLGLYGQTNWRSGVTADWSAAYGRSESESMGSEWNQKQLQLDGRVSYNHELNARTVLSPFAGLQYYASDSATIGTTDTGSLQNLRAEIGVGASHRTGKLGVFGEIAVHQDLARNNPSVSMEGTRYTGMNPGRTGLNFTVGASYELNAQWSVNASYTGEFVENANAHSANVGASYKF